MRLPPLKGYDAWLTPDDPRECPEDCEDGCEVCEED